MLDNHLKELAEKLLNCYEESFNIYKLEVDRIIESNINAIQWSTFSTNPLNELPKKYPITGINAWKIPKYRAIIIAFFQFIFFIDKPLHTETANASIARPIPININSLIIEKMRHPIDWLDSLFNKNFVLDFYNGIGEIEKELTLIAKKDSCFTKGFNKII